MPKENNKMQVDIDTLKKQNVNDLLSIKELYNRIEELGEKITQIKYINNTLIKKIKKEYESLLENNTGTGNIGTANNIITVGKTGCDFTEIQLAINSITDDTPTNRYLILVFAGKYEYFHTWVYGVRPYNTQRYISIVGVSKYDCIVDSAFNSTFASNGILKNMTLICNNTNINTDGLEMYKDYDSVYGYALHIDMKQNEVKGTKIVIEDCDLISYKGATVGMGTWKDDVVTFKRCNIIRKENISGVNHHASKMAFFCHNGPSGTTNQNLNLIDCNISTPYDYAMFLNDIVSKGTNPSYLYCTFINNNIYSAINGFNCITGQTKTNEQALFGLGIILKENSYGNTNNLLNNNIGTELTYR